MAPRGSYRAKRHSYFLAFDTFPMTISGFLSSMRPVTSLLHGGNEWVLEGTELMMDEMERQANEFAEKELIPSALARRVLGSTCGEP